MHEQQDTMGLSLTVFLSQEKNRNEPKDLQADQNSKP